MCACNLLLQATQSLVNAIKFEADGEGDPEARRRLLDAAKALADATSKMVEAAKVSTVLHAASQWCMRACVRPCVQPLNVSASHCLTLWSCGAVWGPHQLPQ